MSALWTSGEEATSRPVELKLRDIIQIALQRSGQYSSLLDGGLRAGRSPLDP